MAFEGLGFTFNVIAAASGIHIPMTRAQTISFVTFEADGSTILTLKESVGGASEQNLVKIEHFWKSPGVGGAWTEVTQTAAATADLGSDAVNDSMVVTIRARQLSEGFDSVEATVDGGICMAFIYDLAEMADPSSLPSNLIA